MASIRGPRSALTDFIEEHGIKVKSTRKTRARTEKRDPTPRKLRRKTMYTSQPVEIANIEAESAEDRRMEEICRDPHSHRLSGDELEAFAAYLGRSRQMSPFFFEYIVDAAGDSLVLFDCSMIPDSLFGRISRPLVRLELHLCGQLSSQTLSGILERSPALETLRVTGAYLLDDIELPAGLRVLDLTHCSRLENRIVDRISAQFELLDELRLSFCYGIDEACVLRTAVRRLYLCETRIRTSFLAAMKDIEHVEELSLKRCVNIDGMDVRFTRIRKLDIEGITDIRSLDLPGTIEDLNIAHCYDMRDFCYPSLRSLNVSHIDLTGGELATIAGLESLETVDVSWCRGVSDETVSALAASGRMRRIDVFGCFELSQASAELAWRLRDSVRIVGNPSETSFLLHRQPMD